LRDSPPPRRQRYCSEGRDFDILIPAWPHTDVLGNDGVVCSLHRRTCVCLRSVGSSTPSPSDAIARQALAHIAASWKDGYAAMFVDMARLMRPAIHPVAAEMSLRVEAIDVGGAHV